jgi:hypothetical protein
MRPAHGRWHAVAAPPEHLAEHAALSASTSKHLLASAAAAIAVSNPSLGALATRRQPAGARACEDAPGGDLRVEPFQLAYTVTPSVAAHGAHRRVERLPTHGSTVR